MCPKIDPNVLVGPDFHADPANVTPRGSCHAWSEIQVEPYTAVLEAREGGRWFERGVDGSECDWGRVLVYSPPTRVAVSWHLDAAYAYDPDPAKTSRVEVTFHDEGNGKTRVELVHSQLDRHGAGWEKIRESIGSAGGWGSILEGFAKSAAG